MKFSYSNKVFQKGMHSSRRDKLSRCEDTPVRVEEHLHMVRASIFASLSVGHGCVAAQATSPEKKGRHLLGLGWDLLGLGSY
mgnify:CR=1 FL=1